MIFKAINSKGGQLTWEMWDHVTKIDFNDGIFRLVRLESDQVEVTWQHESLVNASRIAIKEALGINPGQINYYNEHLFCPPDDAREDIQYNFVILHREGTGWVWVVLFNHEAYICNDGGDTIRALHGSTPQNMKRIYEEHL